MDKIRNVRITKCENSLYIKPARMLYEQDGKEKVWDLMHVHDSVSVLIFNTSRQVLVFVKQFRPAAYFADIQFGDGESSIDVEKHPPSSGITIELCDGIVDKDKSLEEIARYEVLEECGYSVPLSALQKITSYRLEVGISGTRQTLYYTEVTDSMKVSEGGGNADEGEYIEVIEMDLSQANSLIYNEKIARPTTLMFALVWFFQKKGYPN